MKFQYLVHYTLWSQNGSEFHYGKVLEADSNPPKLEDLRRWGKQCEKSSYRVDILSFSRLWSEEDKHSENSSQITQKERKTDAR